MTTIKINVTGSLNLPTWDVVIDRSQLIGLIAMGDTVTFHMEDDGERTFVFATRKSAKRFSKSVSELLGRDVDTYAEFNLADGDIDEFYIK